MAAALIAAACSSSPEEEAASPCVAFAKAAAPSLRVDVGASPSVRSGLVRIAVLPGGAGALDAASRTYALDGDGKLGRIDGAAASLAPVTGATDFVVTGGASGAAVRAFVVRREAKAGSIEFQLVKLTSADGGLTFGNAQILLSAVRPSTAAESGVDAIALGPDGLLYVAIGDAGTPQVDLGTLFGKVLRIDVKGDAYDVPPGNPVAAAAGRPEIWAVDVHQPRGLDVDGETGDLWLTDFSAKDDATLVHRITRGSSDAQEPVLSIAASDARAAAAGGHVYRGKLVPSMVGKYVYPAANGLLVAVDRFGPSGTPLATKFAMGETGAFARGDDKELLVASMRGVGRLMDSAPAAAAPTSLLATKCWDPAVAAGVPSGAVAYDVTTALWSDGAAKDRFVVVPKGKKITARADGDLVFPVGTIAVKTFAVFGKRIETRLLVQHELEDWVGYSYAWNEGGSDAELVIGNRVAPLAGGKSWYFPSAADCSACHTPAAGYTLGLEAKQLVGHGDALARLEGLLAAPLDRGALATLVPADAPAPATAEARARSYLHANCSTCHREGSATGIVVDLDLRVETPLAKTGLCKEPGAGSLGIVDARIVAPRDPARSVIVARMRSLDERRMPKLATRVVDEVGVAAVEAWIRELSACP